MRGTILIAGIHGVGKTTASNKLTHKYNIPNFTASKIIKDRKNGLLSNISKQVTDIDDNQRLLLEGIKELLIVNSLILLDGHFTLLNLNFDIRKIRISVFKGLQLTGVILLQDEPREIYNRLVKRDVNTMPFDLIKKYQDKEKSHAIYITNKLNIPLKILNKYADQDLFTAYEDLTKA